MKGFMWEIDNASWSSKCYSSEMMKQSFLIFFLSVLFVGWAQTETKKRAPHPSVVAIEEVKGLPRVLLIGDSISMGYTLPVRKLLEGRANVLRIPANGGPTTRGLANIDKWLGDGKWDLIHFNWGIHDLRHMDDGKCQVESGAYESNLRKLVARLQETGATLVWATTTPIPDPPLIPDRTFGDEEAYNVIAARVMKENAIPTDDLHAWMLPRFADLHSKQDLHYGDEGYEFLAEKVALEIEANLNLSK